MNEGQLRAEIRAREKQIEALKKWKRIENNWRIFDEIWQRVVFLMVFVLVLIFLAPLFGALLQWLSNG